MGRKSQERMTGRTYEQRVEHAQSFTARLFKRVRAWMKPHENSHIPNVNRSGVTYSRDGLRSNVPQKRTKEADES